MAIEAEALRALPMPALPSESDKNARGRVLVVAGGAAVPGAAVLTGLAALRSGAGKLKLAATPGNAPGLGLAIPEALIVTVAADAQGEIDRGAVEGLREAAADSDAVVIGPGMLGAAARLAVGLARETRGVLLLDAGALTGLMEEAAALRPAAGRLMLTPHAGEMAALTGWDRAAIEADPAAAARHVAAHLQAVVALKGVATHVAAPDGRLWRYEDGAAGLGTSGSGDVLAGVIGGLAARGSPPVEAAIRGVFMHGQAGRMLSQAVAPFGFLAREILDVLPRALVEAHGLPDGPAPDGTKSSPPSCALRYGD